MGKARSFSLLRDPENASMRKIALISEHASPLGVIGGVDAGGQNIYVAHVAQQLAARGLEVDVYTRRDNPHLPDEVRIGGTAGGQVRVIHVPAGPAAEVPKEGLLPYMDAFADFMIARMRRDPNPVDVMHANFFMSGAAALRVRKRLGIPLVVTFHALGRVRRLHQGAADGFPDRRFAIEDELVARADRIVAECEQDLQDLRTLYRADPRRVAVVPCGFDDAEFHPVPRAEARRRLDWDPDEFAILQLGRLVPRKGIDNVIDALAHLPMQGGRPARLFVVGGGHYAPDPAREPELARLMARAAEAGVASRVSFVGRRDRHELRWFYGAADVFVTTPWYEPFGITPVEAMACATPVLGAAVGGIRTTVEDGRTGYLVPPRDPAALAERLQALRADPALCERLGRAGRARAVEHFTWRRVAAQLAEVYRAAVPNPRRARAGSAATHRGGAVYAKPRKEEA